MTKSINKIMWAVDAVEPATYNQNAIFAIGALSRAFDCSVLPVYVFTPVGSRLKTRPFPEAFLALVEKRMRELSQRSELPRMAEGEIIKSGEGSTRAAVEALIGHASEKGADLIVVSTHSKGPVSRFFLGSFAETMLLQSEIPVLSVNPQTKVREKISNILFPTTFEDKFLPAFEETVELARKLDAAITLFYKEPHFAMEELSPELFVEIDRDVSEFRQKAVEWQKRAATRQVPVHYSIDPFPGLVAEEIVRYAAENNMDLVALVSQTEDVSSPRVGGLCRKVVRLAACPVWVMKTGEPNVL